MSAADGGAAFPVASPGGATLNKGMTLRDYFAGNAIQGLAANPGGPWQANPMSGWALANCKLDEVAEVAYQIADAMLAERAK